MKIRLIYFLSDNVDVKYEFAFDNMLELIDKLNYMCKTNIAKNEMYYNIQNIVLVSQDSID